MSLKLKAKVVEHGIKQGELATRLGVRQETVSAKLNGKADLWLGELKIIQELLSEKGGEYTLDELTE